MQTRTLGPLKAAFSLAVNISQEDAGDPGNGSIWLYLQKDITGNQTDDPAACSVILALGPPLLGHRGYVLETSWACQNPEDITESFYGVS